MMLGTIFCNICDFSAELMDRLDRWTAPIYILFFVLSGAELDLTVLTDLMIVLIGVIYIVSRCVGKYFGARCSSQLMGCDKHTVDYLGITLFPQAGVALGMVSTVASDKMLEGTIADTVRFVILFSVLVYEIFGPVLTKWALTKAGDITPKPHGHTRRRKNPEHM